MRIDAWLLKKPAGILAARHGGLDRRIPFSDRTVLSPSLFFILENVGFHAANATHFLIVSSRPADSASRAIDERKVVGRDCDHKLRGIALDGSDLRSAAGTRS